MDYAKEFDAFISYRYKSDEDRAEQLHHYLLTKNLTVFYNKFSLPYAEPWREEFLSSIHQSRVFLPLISRGLLESFENNSGEDFVLMEWDTIIPQFHLHLKCAAELLLSKKIIVFPIFCKVSLGGNTITTFNSNGITLPDIPTMGCTRSAKEIWELFDARNGHYVDFQSHGEMKFLAKEIKKKIDFQNWPAFIDEHFRLQTHNYDANRKVEDISPPLSKTKYPSPRKGEAIPPLSMRKAPSTYIDREDIWSKLEKYFRSNDVCCLRGYGGSGKTFASNDRTWISKSNLDELVTATLNTSRKADLLVLDNVKVHAHVKSLINQSVHGGIKILIICRTTIGYRSEIIMKNPSEESYIEYLRKSMTNRSESNEDYKKIVDLTNQFPLRLFVAAAYLNKFKISP
ncbi:hypothetical protein HK096_005737, partial [Nowakowskiella sp. JEL0078]